MTGDDVYNSEMPERPLSEEDVELLFSGALPEQESLARFATALRSIHDTGSTTPTEEAISVFAEEAAQIVVAARESPTAAATSDGQPVRGFSFVLRRKLAGALGAAVLLSGMTGVAVAADAAAPGDPLYPLDRAMEAVGVGNGGSAERITEAQTMFNEGRVSEAIAHAAEAVETTEDNSDPFSPEASKAAEALKGAAERVAGGIESQDGQGVNEAVAGLLGEIASMLESDEIDLADFGARVSDLARSIGSSRDDVANEDVPTKDPGPPDSGDQGPPVDTPGGPPEDVPAGPPADTPAGPPSGPPEESPGRP